MDSLSPRRHLGLLVLCLLVGILALYQPLFHTGTHIPGEGVTDYHIFHWGFWWVEHALTTPDLNVYQTDYVLYPYQHNLAFHTLAIFWVPFWVAMKSVMGAAVALNLLTLIALTLTGYCMFLLLHQQGVSPSLALLGALTWEVCPPMLRAVFWGHFNLIALFWYPLQFWLWGQVLRSPRKWLWAMVQGFALWAMVLTDSQYPLLLAPILLPYIFLTLWQAPTWQNRRALVGYGLVILVLSFSLLWFFGPLPYFLTNTKANFLIARLEDATGIRDWSAFLTSSADYHNQARPGGVVTAGILLGLLALLLKRVERFYLAWFWFGLLPVPLVLSWGATATFNGQEVRMPYSWLHEPLGGLFRYPDRFAFAFMLAGLVFAGITLSPWMRRVKPSLRPLLVSGLIGLVFINLQTLRPMVIEPLPPHYAIYDQMGREPYDYVVIEVPTAGGTGIHWAGDVEAIALEYYGAFHHKKMINGLLSRAPTEAWWYLRTDDPLLSWLGQRRYLEPDLVEAQLRQIIPAYPVGYILVHEEMVKGLPSTSEEIIGYLNSLSDLFCPPQVEGTLVAFRTRWHPDGCPTTRSLPQTERGYMLDIGKIGDEAYLWAGWHYREQIFDTTLRWLGRAETTAINVELPPADYTVSFSAQAFWEERQVQLWANGQLLTPEPLLIEPDALQNFTVTLPKSFFINGEAVILTFAYDKRLVPMEVLEGNTDPRPLAIALDTIYFQPIDN